MLGSELREIMREMQGSIKTVNAIVAGQSEGWRQEVVRNRRILAERTQRMSSLVAGAPRPASPALLAVRNALSKFRSSVAALQASWPAVSLDPQAPSYLHSVQSVRADMASLEESLSALELEASRSRP